MTFVLVHSVIFHGLCYKSLLLSPDDSHDTCLRQTFCDSIYAKALSNQRQRLKCKTIRLLSLPACFPCCTVV